MWAVTWPQHGGDAASPEIHVQSKVLCCSARLQGRKPAQAAKWSRWDGRQRELRAMLLLLLCLAEPVGMPRLVLKRV